MKYFISAGEPSGDLHASELIAAIMHTDKSAEIAFLGGDLMAAAAGCEPVIHYREMAFMGFSEVLRHLPQIASNMKRAQSHRRLPSRCARACRLSELQPQTRSLCP